MSAEPDVQGLSLARRYRPAALARRCGEAYGVPLALALGTTRGSKEVWAARQLLMLLLHEHYRWSYAAIGRCIGRDHATVHWGVMRARGRLAAPEHAWAYRWVIAPEGGAAVLWSTDYRGPRMTVEDREHP